MSEVQPTAATRKQESEGEGDKYYLELEAQHEQMKATIEKLTKENMEIKDSLLEIESRLNSLERNSRSIVLPMKPIRDGAIIRPTRRHPENITSATSGQHDEPQRPNNRAESVQLVTRWITGMLEYLRMNSRWWTYRPSQSEAEHPYQTWQYLMHFLAFEPVRNQERDGVYPTGYPPG
ncbi:hypothetical protein EB796_000065 [Bugula neritina]|uniref:Uncharacterized protein n=1 Tax=Bugula neritina TaxID=10212 RepID=A0A7J7KTY1_BUGNE|nr:hypothetical protein EB796_000065 [Bugula neritina]